MCFTTRPVESFEVLNDLVVDRGPSPYVSLLELFGDEQHMTTVQADGLTVSTPTGSTAYSLSAGGSLVHPEIPAILITPICPHTLSFRPMLLPDTMELRICVPFNSRSTAWASFDGRGRVELKQGDHIKVTASRYPFPTVCAINQSTDWFSSISRTLKWNERERQKSFVMVEEGPSASAPAPASEAEEEEEEDKFDIDDSAPENATSAEAPKPPSSPVASKVRTPRATKVELSPDIRIHQNGHTSPDRYHPSSSIPHPQQYTPQHIHFAEPESSHGAAHRKQGENGDRDHIHNPKGLQGTKSKIPTNREIGGDNVRTPRPDDILKTQERLHHRLRRHRQPGEKRNRSLDLGARRAFAVWGQDDTDDSGAGDSDAGY
jgi:NAD+ kinase